MQFHDSHTLVAINYKLLSGFGFGNANNTHICERASLGKGTYGKFLKFLENYGQSFVNFRLSFRDISFVLLVVYSFVSTSTPLPCYGLSLWMIHTLRLI